MFLILSFRVKTAPTTFVRLVDQMLKELGDFAVGYIDIVIVSQKWEEYLTPSKDLRGRPPR